MRTSGLWRFGIAGALLLLSGAIASRSATLAASTSGPDPARVARLISVLNACIQDRFKDVDERFGAARIVTVDSSPHVFRPERAAEFDVVTALEQADLRVVLYLTSRHAPMTFVEFGASKEISPAAASRRITGPVWITSAAAISAAGSDGPHTLPRSLDLWDESRRALEAFATSDAHEFRSGSWQFTAKPIRASDAVCLKCHRNAKIGDPLGAVLYGYQPR